MTLTAVSTIVFKPKVGSEDVTDACSIGFRIDELLTANPCCSARTDRGGVMFSDAAVGVLRRASWSNPGPIALRLPFAATWIPGEARRIYRLVGHSQSGIGERYRRRDTVDR